MVRAHKSVEKQHVCVVRSTGISHTKIPVAGSKRGRGKSGTPGVNNTSFFSCGRFYTAATGSSSSLASPVSSEEDSSTFRLSSFAWITDTAAFIVQAVLPACNSYNE